MNSKYFNNKQVPAQQRRVKNRRDADNLKGISEEQAHD